MNNSIFWITDKSTRLLALISGLLFGLITGPAALAWELRLTTANDPVSGNREPDDLYTAALGVDLLFQDHQVYIGERMFTDRQRELRFDETEVLVSFDHEEWAGWSVGTELGVLRVGRGLLGERVQNQIHSWVGSEEVHYAYLDESHWYPQAEIQLARVLVGGRRSIVGARVEAHAAPGFRNWVRAELFADHKLIGPLNVRAGLGARADTVDSSDLGDHIADLGLTWEATVSYKDLFLRWSYNDYGTETRHVTLGLKIDVGGHEPPP